tara:strand:- start:2203 stop:2691 length:489 start_codon:yes stop_codon:yes gene_type:complete
MSTFKLVRDLSHCDRWLLETLDLYVRELMVEAKKPSAIKHYANLVTNLQSTLLEKTGEIGFDEMVSRASSLVVSTTPDLSKHHNAVCVAIKRVLNRCNIFLDGLFVDSPIVDTINEAQLLNFERKAWNIAPRNKRSRLPDAIGLFFLWRTLLRKRLSLCYFH